jgi:hypothetical protein
LSFVPAIVKVTPALIVMLWLGGLVCPIQSLWMFVLAVTTLSTVASATAPGLKKRASSFVPGDPVGDQLAAVSQSPPLGPDQVYVAAEARCANAMTVTTTAAVGR